MSTTRGRSRKYSISMSDDMGTWLDYESRTGPDQGNASMTIRRLLWPIYQEFLRKQDIAKIKEMLASGKLPL